MKTDYIWPNILTDEDLLHYTRCRDLHCLIQRVEPDASGGIPTENATIYEEPGMIVHVRYWRADGHGYPPNWLHAPAGVAAVRAYDGHRLRMELEKGARAGDWAAGAIRCGRYLYLGLWADAEVEADQAAMGAQP